MRTWTKKRTRNFYTYMLAHHLTTREAIEFSTLRRGLNDPTLKLIIRDRDVRWNRFEKVISRKIRSGVWTQRMVEGKWAKNLRELYEDRNWLVMFGPTGFQQRMEVGFGNPWACYRSYEKITPDVKDGYIAPWQLRRYRGKSRLERGLIFVRKLERGKSKASLVQILSWIQQKEDAVKKARDPRRKKQLRREIRRLEALT